MGKLYMVVGKWLLIRPEKSYLCHSLFTHTCSTSDVASFSRLSTSDECTSAESQVGGTRSVGHMTGELVSHPRW